MAVLSANVDNLVSSDPGMSAAGVYQATTIYKGSWACYNATGYAIAAADAAGNTPAGLASDQVVNAGSSGALKVPLWTAGEVLATFDAITQADVGKVCYVLDSGALTIYNAVNNIPMAVLREYISATSGRVEIVAGALGGGSTESAAVDDIELYKVDAATTCTVGTFLMVDSAVGDVRPGADTTNMRLAGVAIETVINAGASGAALVATRIRGKQICVAVTADDTWIGKTCYLTAANTVALTSTHEVAAGTIRNVISATSVVVEYNAVRITEKTLLHATGDGTDVDTYINASAAKIFFSNTAQKGKKLYIGSVSVTGVHDLDLTAEFATIDFALVSYGAGIATALANSLVVGKPGAVAGHVDICSMKPTGAADCTLIDSTTAIPVTVFVIGTSA